MTFTTDRDIDSAAADVRDAVGSVVNRLPDEADEPRVVKADSDSQPVLRIALTSDRLPTEDLTDLAERAVVDRLTTVSGVAKWVVFQTWISYQNPKFISVDKQANNDVMHFVEFGEANGFPY